MHYHRRYSRLNIADQTLDATAQFDYELKQKSQTSDWHSVNKKIYLKVNERTRLANAVSGTAAEEKDYLLQAGVAAIETQQIWFFIKQDSVLSKEYDGVIALDYTNHGTNQYIPRLIKSDGSSSTFPTIARDIQATSIISQFDDLTLFYDLSCTTGCNDGDPTSRYEYRVSSINHSDTATAAKILHHETCDTVNTDPASQTCTVN